MAVKDKEKWGGEGLKTGPQARFMLSESELLELLLQFLQHAFLLVDLGFALLDGFFQLFLLGHDVSPLNASVGQVETKTSIPRP